MMLQRELTLFFTALMFYTRLPCPRWVGHSSGRLNAATRYFPLIGWIVGGVMAGAIFLAHFVLPLSVSVLIGLATSVLVTGAFHEDGWADVCDGFGGGWTQEQILVIMKDSRLGTFGTMGLCFLIGTKFFALYEMGQRSLPLLLTTTVASHAASRGMAAILIRTHRYVRDDDDSKAKPIAQRLSLPTLLISSGLAAVPLLLFSHSVLVLSVVPPLLLLAYLGRYFERWIGGYTGDCLGATQQLCELTMTLSVLALWTFI